MGLIIRSLLTLCVIACALALPETPSPNEVVPEDALVDSHMTDTYRYLRHYDAEVEQGSDITEKNDVNKFLKNEDRTWNAASWAMVKQDRECTGDEQSKGTITYDGTEWSEHRAAVTKCNKKCTSQNFILGGTSHSGDGRTVTQKCYCEQPTANGDCDGLSENNYNLYKKSDAWVRETENSECDSGSTETYKHYMTLDMCAAACTTSSKVNRGFIFGKSAGKCVDPAQGLPAGLPKGSAGSGSWCQCYCEQADDSATGCTAEANNGFDTYKFGQRNK